MIQFKKILLVSLTLGFAQTMLFSFTQLQEPVVTKATEQTLVFLITPSNFIVSGNSTLTNDGKENLGLIQVGTTNNLIDVTLGAKRVSSSGSNLLLSKDQGVIYNTTPLPGSVSIVNIKQQTGQGTALYLGSSSRLVSSATDDFAISGPAYASENSNNQSYTIANASLINYSYFALISNGGQQNTITELKFTVIVSEVVVQNAATFNFSVEFVLDTNNKEDLCTAEGLNWSFWETEFNKLSEANKTAFRTDTTDGDIVVARERYQYLRSFNSLLVNFASI